MKKILALILLLVVHREAAAQRDSTHIAPFERNLSTRVFLSQKFISLEQSFNKGENTINYMPTMPTAIGFGAAWRGVGLNVLYGFDAFKNRKEKSQALDLQYHFYGRRWVTDFYGQVYSGFYADDEVAGVEDEFRSDLVLVKLGGFVQYAFNHEKFSSRAAFGQNERQLRSAGSWLLGMSGYYTHILADSAIMGNESKQHRNILLGPNIGYAYIWVLKKNFFISATLAAGFHVGFENLEAKKVKLYPLALPRVVFGYNAEKWSIGLSALYNMTYVAYDENVTSSLNSGDVRLTFTWRIRMQSKFLDKITLYRE